MNRVLIPIQEPEIIALVHEIRNGKVPISELRKKLGRHRADRAISKCTAMILRLKLSCAEYVEDPIKCEWEFVKECLGIHNGREKIHYKLSESIEVQQPSDQMMLLLIK